jgi:dCTP diphosphatase
MDADGLTNTMEGMQQRLQMTSSSSSNSIAEARDMIFNLGSIFGRMCGHFLSLPRDDDNGTTNARVHTSNSSPTSVVATVDEITSVAKLTLGEALVQLLTLANALHLDLRTCILKKIDLNGKKYPVEHCRGKSGKYTEYSHHTGIKQTVGQCTIDNTITDATSTTTTESVEENHTIEGITLIIRKFANDREWNKYHTSRNIALAILGELGELAELFQWIGDDDNKDIGSCFTMETLDKIGQEMADVSIYLIRLCDVCNVKLGEVVLNVLDEKRNY